MAVSRYSTEVCGPCFPRGDAVMNRFALTREKGLCLFQSVPAWWPRCLLPDDLRGEGISVSRR